ncbi:ABC transporter permease [Microvirga rosea]|uniref:ABC transporter permease n=1 Tax=Microvirga rosea TaxID=2715425 RepID=UPI001D0B8FF1|nr:ABC transporter permease [Microvirga rosea]MCB8823226.1 ABC transporter permease [Microvirga rosea]
MTMSRKPRIKTGPILLGLPAGLFLLAFFLVPLGYVTVLSFSDPSWGIANYRELFNSRLFLMTLGNTFWMAAVVTGLSLLLAYPLAYVAATSKGTLGKTILMIVALSFWTSYLVRTYAWMVILGVQGPIPALVALFGHSPPPRLLFTSFAATLGMTHGLIPFMTMALFAVMKRIDPKLMDAAGSLGARPWRVFWHIYLPLSAPGIINGITLVFITCLGFYVMPVLLGSPREQTIAGLIGDRMEQILDFGGAAAMSLVLLAASLGLFSVYSRYFGMDRLWGGRI